MPTPNSLPAWSALEAHRAELGATHMRDLFASNPGRFDGFHLQFDEILLDYSKNIITEKTVGLLRDLARQAGVPEMARRMFSGDKINTTEQRDMQHGAIVPTRRSWSMART